MRRMIADGGRTYVIRETSRKVDACTAPDFVHSLLTQETALFDNFEFAHNFDILDMCLLFEWLFGFRPIIMRKLRVKA